jgi:hypothetical protein
MRLYSMPLSIEASVKPHMIYFGTRNLVPNSVDDVLGYTCGLIAIQKIALGMSQA